MKNLFMFLAIFFAISSLLAEGKDEVVMWIKKKTAIASFEKVYGVKIATGKFYQLDKGNRVLTPELKAKVYGFLDSYFQQNFKNDLADSCKESEANYHIKIKVDRYGNELELEVFLKDLSTVPKDMLDFLKSDLIKLK